MAAINISDLAEAPKPGQPAPAEDPRKGAISLADLAEPPPPKPQGKLSFAAGAAAAVGKAEGKAVAKGAVDWWNAVGKEAGVALKSFHDDTQIIAHAGRGEMDRYGNPISPSAPEAIIAGANSLLDVVSFFWSPVTATVNQLAEYPGKGIKAAGEITKDQLSPEYRRNHPGATKNVDQNVADLTEFVRQSMQMVAGMAGMGEAKGAERLHVDPDVPGGPKEPKEVPKAPPPDPADTRPLIEQIKSTKNEIAELTKRNAHDARIAELEGKLAAHKMDLHFEELATKNPEAAAILADKVSEVAPEVGKKMKLKVKLKTKATPEEQVIVGKDVAGADAPVHARPDESEDHPWIKDSEGKPLTLYRGVIGGKAGIPEGALRGKPRDNYSVFSSTSPHVANTYATPHRDPNLTGAVVPMHIAADKVIEFPTKTLTLRDGTKYKTFDKFEFDKQASRLKPGEALVVRDVVDMGPWDSPDKGHQKLASFPSDIYAIGKDTKTRSAVSGVHNAPGDTGAPLHKEWQDLHKAMLNSEDPEKNSVWSELYLAKIKGLEVGTHRLLDNMIELAPGGSAVRSVLLQLRKYVKDAPIHVVENIGKFYGKDHNNSAGIYDPATGRIYIRAKEEGVSPFNVQTIVHEIFHAATVDFMEANPDHPLVKEARDLWIIAKERMAVLDEEAKQNGINLMGETEKVVPGGGMGQVIPPWGSMYGVTDPFEMIAEAHANPEFVRLLTKSEKFAGYWDQLKDVVHKLAFKMAEMLGIKKPSQAKLLHNILTNAEGIMKEQAWADRAKRTMQEVDKNLRGIHAMAEGPSKEELTKVTAGVREAAGEINSSLEKESVRDPSDAAAFMRIQGKLPRAVNVAIGKLAEYNRQIRGVFNIRSLGPGAEAAATLVQEATARRAQHMLMMGKDSVKRRNFWNKMTQAATEKWMQGAETGARFKDPALQAATEGYKKWAQDIYEQDMRTGFDYDPVSHYLPRLYKSGSKIPIEEFLQKRFGSKWKNPAFIKERGFKMIKDALDAGYELKHTNPEDMMMARQYASDTAEMQVNILNDLEKYGYAVRATGDMPPAGYTVQRRSPTGQMYWVNRDSAKVLKNAFDTYSLWSDRSMVGDAFRGFMNLKNTLVPIRLMGLFHVVHVGFAIDTAAAFNRLSKELLIGKAADKPRALWEGVKSGMPLVSSFVTNPRKGWSMMKAYKGEIDAAKLTTAQKEILEFANEGGFVPFLDRQWKTNAEQKFMDALQKHSATALFHAPGALISAISKPIFEHWIPSLKAASFMSETETLFRLRPELLDNPFERRKALSQITQMIDRRFGEMNLQNQFWPRWVKDLAVMNTLSIGWQLGVVGEFGGGLVDAAKMPFRGSPLEQLRTGKLDKTIYAAGYTAIAMGYTGLMSYTLSGQQPTGEDWIWPRNGKTNPDGSPQRLSTPFFTREFGSIYKHVRDEGLSTATKDIIESKSSGMIGLATEAAFGVNSLGEEIRDPYAPAYKKLEQTLAYMLRDIEPISAQQSSGASRQTALSVSGFTPAPKYVTDTPTTSAIKTTYRKYYTGKTTPFERAQTSDAISQLKEAYAKEDMDKYDKVRDKMEEEFKLTPAELRKIDARVRKGQDATVTMFTRLNWKQQKDLLDKMTPEEREIYLPHSNRDHLRYTYEAPE